ncbi:MAG: hypothetical protein ACE14P_05080 [Methanotrichaceae archaeon]
MPEVKQKRGETGVLWSSPKTCRNVRLNVTEKQNILPQNWRGRISVLAKTREEFEAVLPPLYLGIALDGLILYDPQNYAATQLQKFRRLIQSKDLRR